MRARTLLILLAFVPVGCGLASGDPPAQVRYPFVLTPEELGLARELAERDLPLHELASCARHFVYQGRLAAQ